MFAALPAVVVLGCECCVGRFPVAATATAAAMVRANPPASSFGCHSCAAVLLSPVR